MTIRHTTRRSAQRALDAQIVNGFCVDIGTCGRYFVSHPTPQMWILMDRTRDGVVLGGTIRQVLDTVFGSAVMTSWRRTSPTATSHAD